MTDMTPSAEERADELIEGRWNHDPRDENGEAVEVLTTALVRFLAQAYADGAASRDAEIREAVEREREACAVLAHDFLWDEFVEDIRRHIAAAIRARGDRP